MMQCLVLLGLPFAMRPVSRYHQSLRGCRWATISFVPYDGLPVTIEVPHAESPVAQPHDEPH